MYDKSDPRATLGAPKGDTKSGSTTMPASFGLYYRDPPVEDDANGRGWYTRSQNLVVHWIEAKPGATFSRTGQVDEYMIVVPDDDTPYEATALVAGAPEAKREFARGMGYQLLIVPPGDSRITLARMNSFHAKMKAKTEVDTRPGAMRGKRILRNAWPWLQPSIMAASSRSLGMFAINPRRVQMVNGSTNAR